MSQAYSDTMTTLVIVFVATSLFARSCQLKPVSYFFAALAAVSLVCLI